jgi:KRAB domain-containing zinc finger protein
VALGPNENAKKQHELVQTSCDNLVGTDQQGANVKPESSKLQHRCMLCNCCYTLCSNLMQHMHKKHTGLFIQCKHNHHCTKIFRTETEKSEHLLELKIKIVSLGKCDFCDKVLYDREVLNHMQTYHKGENLVRCSYHPCSIFFRSEVEKQNHEALVHATIEKRKCIFCDLLFPPYAMFQHLIAKHKSLLTSAFKCKYKCKRYFLTEAELNEHIASVHETCLVRSEVKCIYCNKICTDKNVLNSHIYNNHSLVRIRCKFYGCNQYFHTQTLADEHFEHQHLETEENKRFHCLNCNFRAAHRGPLKIHISRMHGDKILQCSRCTKRFSTDYTLKNHVKSVHASLKECPHCNNRYLGIKAHLKQEKCNTCQKVLLCARSAQVHKKMCKLKTRRTILDKVFSSIEDDVL